MLCVGVAVGASAEGAWRLLTEVMSASGRGEYPVGERCGPAVWVGPPIPTDCLPVVQIAPLRSSAPEVSPPRGLLAYGPTRE